MASLQNTIKKTVTRFHVLLYRSSGGKIWKTMQGFPVLILTTTGRKSGKTRSTPVVYIRDDNNYMIAASNGGFKNHSSWYYNITANNNIRVDINGKTHWVTAEILEGEERDKAYEIFKSQGDNFVKYEKQTEGIRTIPVIRLAIQ